MYHTGLSFPDPVVGVKNIPNTFLAENYTSGGEGITYHDTDAVNEGEIFRHDGVDIEPCSDGNANIFSIQAGEWIDYRLNVPNTASYKLEFRMSSPQGEGAFRVEVDGVDKTGRLTVPRTAGFQIWTTFSVTDIPLTAGVHTFRFVMEEAGFNFAGFAVSFAQPEIPVGKRITMKMGANYVTYNAQNQLVCNSPTITPECVFTVLQNGRFIELRAANGQYVSTASVKTPMTLTGNNQAADSKFLWHNLQANGQLFGLKSLKTNAVVCSENGTKAMNCDRYDFGGWEKFTWAEYAPVGIAALPVDARLPVYFDAARGELFLPEAAAGDWQIFDVSGRRMPGGKRSNSLSVPVSAFPAGVYIVKAGGRTGKFIKH
ncbi:MAG: carbohydrate-binding protein [Dysgonamonadaceae bacterium]|nr:carbohydrate-binding protein [Dysgonamonadaceae bacterium]